MRDLKFQQTIYVLEHALTERRGYKETGPEAAETGLHLCKSVNKCDMWDGDCRIDLIACFVCDVMMSGRGGLLSSVKSTKHFIISASESFILPSNLGAIKRPTEPMAFALPFLPRPIQLPLS